MNHLNSKVVLGLGAAAVAALIAAGVVSSLRKPVSETAQAERGQAGYALPDLRAHVNDVKAITLTTAEEKTAVHLTRTEQGWTVLEKSGYPADTGKLRELLLQLADAHLLEQKTSSAARYAELGVEDVKNKEARGVLLSLEGIGAKPARLIVGNVSAKGNGTFVRRPEEPASWLAKGRLTVERDPAQWLDQSLTDIDAGKIAEIILTKPDGKSLRVYKDQPGDAGFKLADLPKGREAAEASTLGALASTLSGLSLSDVLPAQGGPAPEGNPLQARYRTFDGLTVEARGWVKDGKHYARFTASLDQARAEAFIQAEQARAKAEHEARQKEAGGDAAKVPAAPLAVSDAGKDRQQRLDGLNRSLGELQRRFGGWVFVIPEYKYADMDKGLEDLLKPVETAGKEAGKEKPEGKK